MLFRKVIKLFKSGNVCVSGLRGKGKDLLFGNVIARRKKESYISNLDYTNDNRYLPIDFDKLDCGKNTYLNLVTNNINYYSFEYPLKSDVYLSDCGIYFPSQYCNELNKRFPYLATYQALSRQVSHNNFHVNAQNLNRVWDKIREQSDTYIWCEKCIYIFGLVIQQIIIYDKYSSAVNRVKPCRVSIPLFASKEAKMQGRIYVDNFVNQNGSVKSRWLIYFNKSKHDTYYFEKLFKKGVKKDEKNNN